MGICTWLWNAANRNFKVIFTGAWSEKVVLSTIPKYPSRSQKNWYLSILDRLKWDTRLLILENCNESTLLTKDCINHKSCKLNLTHKISHSTNSAPEIAIVLPLTRSQGSSSILKSPATHQQSITGRSVHNWHKKCALPIVEFEA